MTSLHSSIGYASPYRTQHIETKASNFSNPSLYQLARRCPPQRAHSPPHIALQSSINIKHLPHHRTMSNSSSPLPSTDLTASGLTIPSDSEPYSSLSPPTSSPSPPDSQNNTSRPVIIYQPPTIWSLLRGAAINLLLPFVNGMMLGFGELLAHEAAFRLGWGGTNVSIYIFIPCNKAHS